MKQPSVSIYNLILSTKLALLYDTINMQEYKFILGQLMALENFEKWREPTT